MVKSLLLGLFLSSLVVIVTTLFVVFCLDFQHLIVSFINVYQFINEQ